MSKIYRAPGQDCSRLRTALIAVLILTPLLALDGPAPIEREARGTEAPGPAPVLVPSSELPTDQPGQDPGGPTPVRPFFLADVHRLELASQHLQCRLATLGAVIAKRTRVRGQRSKRLEHFNALAAIWNRGGVVHPARVRGGPLYHPAVYQELRLSLRLATHPAPKIF